MAAAPDLIDDAIAEILLLLPPDDPVCLARAAVVCKLWLRVLSDPSFPRRYREFHGTPPLLGFLVNPPRSGYGPSPRFVPTTAASPFPQRGLNDSDGWIFDCRHGRVLVEQYDACNSFMYFVWDPIAGDLEEFHIPDSPSVPVAYTLAVLCAVAGCDHVGCHGDPFLVIFLGTDCSNVHVCVYSSETRAWGMPVSVPANGFYDFDMKRGALTRDNIYYCYSEPRDTILKYALNCHSLSVIDPPEIYKASSLLMPNEDGSLGIASIKHSILYLWSRIVNTKGNEEWIQTRVVELDVLFSIDKSCKQIFVNGFAEDVGFIYLRTDNDVVFTFELKSGRVTKVSELGGVYAIFPFTRFYTPDYASSKLPLPATTQ